ncbi:MAG: nucleotide sugar dehydrogenase [Kiritimatiellae bacterium]|nr:nucleotide sugar dehydrogenase [Kiritimatiellia bacterium]
MKRVLKAKKICIIGGCGHVGTPLGLAFASRNFDVTLLDVNPKAVENVNKAHLPFKEDGATELLKAHVGRNLRATSDAGVVKKQDVVVFVTGTPVDEHLNPKIHDVMKVLAAYLPYLNKRQLVVLRSTIFPGVTRIVEDALKAKLGAANLAFCPERIVQGKGIEEIFNLPQLVSGVNKKAENAAAALFSAIAPKIIRIKPEEAELAKLMTNAWRYLEFAIANQFYMMVEKQGLDFYRILRAMKDDYPRAKHFAGAGLAAGPCLFKDTMQLSAFHNNEFFLGHSAMLVNEGLPNFLVSQLEAKMGSLKGKKIGIMGMAFKPDNDDIRESLSFKVKKLLEMKMAKVLVTDEFVPGTTPLKAFVKESDGIILGVPHSAYRKLRIRKPFVDCWGCWRNG